MDCMIVEGSHEGTKVRKGNLQFLFIGSVFPREMFWEYELSQSATIQTQGSLLDALLENGNGPDCLLTTLPVKRWPNAGFQSIQREDVTYGDSSKEGGGVVVKFLGWNNFEPIKTLSIGIDGFLKFLQWSNEQKSLGAQPIALMYNLGPTHHLAPFFVLAAKFSGAKIVSLVTDLEPRSFSLRGIVGWLSYRLQCWSLKQMDGLLPLNQNVIRDLNYTKPSKQIFGILPSDDFAMKLSHFPVSNSGDPIFLFTGSLNEVRGISLLLEAFRGWENPKAQLLITGRGEQEPLVSKNASEDARIEYLGFLKTEEELLGVYERATFVVNPHRMYPMGARYVFPSKLTEYMASGRYVISSNHGEIEGEYKEFMSIYFEDNAQSLREKLVEAVALDSATRNDRILLARKRVLEHQLWKHHSKEVANFLENI